MPEQEIAQIKERFITSIMPLRIYLFGSFAEGRATEDSDFDFYLVVKNGTADLADLTAKAYKAIRNVRTRAVDIIIGTEDRFAKRRNIVILEHEVFHKGVLLYGTES